MKFLDWEIVPFRAGMEYTGFKVEMPHQREIEKGVTKVLKYLEVEGWQEGGLRWI